jgi:hypothetical protein
VDDTAGAPSRQSHRELRAAYRRAKIRQRLVGIPIALAGVALIALGVSSFLNNQGQGTEDVRVGGVTLERPSSTLQTTTTSTPDGGTPSSLGELPMPGTGEDAPALPTSVPRPSR